MVRQLKHRDAGYKIRGCGIHADMTTTMAQRFIDNLGKEFDCIVRHNIIRVTFS